MLIGFCIIGLCVGLIINLFNRYAIDNTGESMPMYIKSILMTILIISLEIIIPTLMGIQNIIFEYWPLAIEGNITLFCIPFWFLISPILFYANDTMTVCIRLHSNTKKPPSLTDYFKDLLNIDRDVFSSFPKKM